MIENNSIINGDCRDVLKKIDDNSIDMILTSPPYDDLRDYNGTLEWNFDIFKEISYQLYRVLKNGGVLVWVVGDKTNKGFKSMTSYKQALHFTEIGFGMYDTIIYEKAGAKPPHPNRYSDIFEYMFILSKGKPKTINIIKDKPNKWAGTDTFGKVTRRQKDGTLTVKEKLKINEYGVRTNIWRYVNGKGFATKDNIAYKHPAIFPENLSYDHIISWTDEDDLVLDPFAGSGTTVKMCKILKRNYIAIEKSKEYCDIIHQRTDNFLNI